MRARGQVEWVRISRTRRVGYAILAAALWSVFAALAWLVVRYGRGLIESAILGATVTGGAAAAFFAASGKEQRRKPT